MPEPDDSTGQIYGDPRTRSHKPSLMLLIASVCLIFPLPDRFHPNDRLVGNAGASASAHGSNQLPRTTVRTDAGGLAIKDPDGRPIQIVRAETDGGAVGDARVRYAPSDSDYLYTVRHVGPIPRGHPVPVEPIRGR